MPLKTLRRHAFLPARHLMFGLAAAAAQPGIAQQAPPAVPPAAGLAEGRRLLAEQGRYWQSRGNARLAADAWSRVEARNPDDAEALYGLAWAETTLGHTAQAAVFTARLRALPAGGAYLARLAQDAALVSRTGVLKQARDLAAQGKGEEAAVAYRTVFGNLTPTGALALEFYKTLGGTFDGWEEARTGLQRLAAESPADNRIALALAQHLTYADGSRREGIDRLAVLAEKPDVGREADAAWRKALGWLAVVPSDMRYFQAYMRGHPQDTALRTTITELARATADGAYQQIEPDPMVDRVERGMAALRVGRLPQAEIDFEAALRLSPLEPRGLGGMGLVRLRQQRFAESADYLERAQRNSRPGQAVQYRDALRSARYWTLLGQAETRRKEGDQAGALALLAQAGQLNPGEPSTDLALASVHAEAGNKAEVVAAYERVRLLRPDDVRVLESLAEALYIDGRGDGAQQIIDQLTPAQQAALPGLGVLRGRLKSAAARAALLQGDPAAAEALFAEAIRNDPQDPWSRLSMVQLLQQSNRNEQARMLMEAQPPVAADASPAAIAAHVHARTLYDYALDDWAAARAGLEKLPAESRSPDMNALLRRSVVLQTLAGSEQDVREGRRADAFRTRELAVAAADEQGDLLLLVAIACAKAGDADAIAQARSVFARVPPMQADTAPGPYLAYAAALFTAGQEELAAPLLARLAELKLDAAQRKGVEGMQMSTAIGRINDRLKAGDTNGAAEALAVAQAAYPTDARLLVLRARLLAASGRHVEALAAYQQALDAAPDDTSLLLGALSAAMSSGTSQVEPLIERAMAVASNDPRVLMAAARYYRSAGRTQRAEQLFDAAVALDAQNAARQRERERPRAGPDRISRASPEARFMRRVALVEPEARSVEQPSAERPWVRPLPPEERSSLQQDLENIRFERSPEVSSGLVVRSRKGESGMSKLTDAQAPQELRWTAGDTRLLLRITPTNLNAGMPDLASASGRFGAGGAGAPGSLPGDQRDRGVGVAVGFERPDLQADIGTTPIGWQQVNVVGGVKVLKAIDKSWSWSADLSRRAVTDSVLSFAGARDGRTGAEWGGVTATGARLQLGWDQGRWGLYGFAAGHVVRGDGVADNHRLEGGGGLYAHAIQQPDNRLTTGLNLSLLGYERNLRYFTVGQGGYFSPQRFAAIGIPLDWTARNGDFAWRMRGSVGVQRLHEDASNFFPLDSAAQARAQAAGVASYPGQQRTSFAYNASLALEYKATPYVSMGAYAGADNSRDYRQVSAGVYLRATFEPSRGPSALLVQPVRSPYGNP